MKHFAVLVVLFGTLAHSECPSWGDPSADQSHQEVESELQLVLDSVREAYEGVGISAAVVFSDGSVWTGVSGVSHDSVPMTAEMVFGIGSLRRC